MKNKIIKSHYRYLANHWWLKSYHLFSFAHYFDEQNISFWNLRVFNDDYIAWNTGFWLHPHSNMEILTIILDGEITHWDSLWNKETIKKWQIQTMTAWTGIFHSEENLSEKEVHLYQIWFLPSHIWNKPSYKDINISIEKNNLNLIATNTKIDWAWYLDSDIKVFLWNYDELNNFTYEIKENRGLFLYMTSWELDIWIEKIIAWDQLRYIEKWVYEFKILKNSEFILIDVKI